MDEPEVILNVALPADEKATKVAEPGEGPFHDPAPLDATRCATVLSSDFPIVTIARNELDTGVMRESCVQRIAIVGLVADQSFGPALAGDTLEDLVDERNFGG